MSADFEDPNLPLYPGTLRGYRYWQIKNGGTTAASVIYTSHDWTYPVTVAECLRGRQPLTSTQRPPTKRHHHQAIPHQGCTCGIYAWHHPCHDDEWRIDRDEDPNLARHYFAFGVISAWGKIIPGTKGFKAEKAKIEAIRLLPPVANEYRDEATQIHETFKANHPRLRYFDTKEDLLAAYPPQEVEWSK